MRIDRFRLGRALSVYATAAAVLAAGALAAAQSAAPEGAAGLPSARSIIERHIEATGGRKAVLAHSSTRATGTFTMPANGMAGTIELFAAKPNRVLARVSLPGIGEVLEGFDGTVAWTSSPMTGPMIASEKEREQKKFDADYYGDLNVEKRYKSIKTLEKTEFEGRPCYKVALVRHDGTEDLEYFDVETGLKAGRVATREMPMGPVKVSVAVSDYRKSGGVLAPTTIKQTAMGVQTIITLQTVEYDKVDPSVFELPPAIKALVK